MHRDVRERPCARTRRGNRYAVFVRKRTPTGENGVHRAAQSPAVGARNAQGRAGAAKHRDVRERPCARTRRGNRYALFVRKRTPTGENGVHRAARSPAAFARKRAPTAIP